MTSKVNIKRTPTLLTKNLLAVGRVSPPNHHPSLHETSFINQLGRVFPIYDFPQLEQKEKLLKVMPQLQLRRGDSGIRIKSVHWEKTPRAPGSKSEKKGEHAPPWRAKTTRRKSHHHKQDHDSTPVNPRQNQPQTPK